jgi:multidrug efflux pump subunit AcrA (membrane-fusion protein)
MPVDRTFPPSSIRRFPVRYGSWTFAVPAALLICAGAPPSRETVVIAGDTAARAGRPATVTAPATVQAYFTTDLYAKDSGYVSHVNADIGDHVEEAQVLAVIADPETRALADKAGAGVQQAKAALEVAQRQLVGLQADSALQLLTLRRQKELFAGKAATPQTLDEAKAKEQASEANVETGQANVALAQANLQAAEAESRRLQALLDYTKIVAPFTGVVTRRLVNLGDLVQAATATRTTALFTLQRLDTVRVLAEVPEANADEIRPGWPATVKLYANLERVVPGAVTRMASALDPASRTMTVEIDLPNPGEAMLPGMYAEVTFGPAASAVHASKQ